MDKRPYILAVDDNPYVLLNLEQLLVIKGFKVDTARDGKDAEELVLKNKYDLLITDIDMPRAGGFELAEFIKDKDIKLPIIFARGASPTAEDYARVKSLGGVALLTKPFPLDKLYGTIEKAIDPTKK